MVAHAELRCIYRCEHCGKKHTDAPQKSVKCCGRFMNTLFIIPEVWGHHECC